MKKFFIYSLLTIFLFSSSLICEAKPKKVKKKPTMHKVEFTTRDKFIIVGDLYFAQNVSNKPLVVCLHSYSMNAKVWKDLAQNLRLKDYNVFAMDLRGHGRSVYNEQLKLKSRFYFSDETWQKVPKDVLDSVKYIKANYPKINCEDVILIGADLGAGVAANSAILFKKPPLKMILISPMIEFKGVTLPIYSEKLGNTEIFVLLSKTEKKLFNFKTSKIEKVKQYKIGGPGNQLIKLNQEAMDDTVSFIIN